MKIVKKKWHKPSITFGRLILIISLINLRILSRSNSSIVQSVTLYGTYCDCVSFSPLIINLRVYTTLFKVNFRSVFVFFIIYKLFMFLRCTQMTEFNEKKIPTASDFIIFSFILYSSTQRDFI